MAVSALGGGIRFRLEVDGLPVVDRVLGLLAGVVKDWRPVWGQVHVGGTFVERELSWVGYAEELYRTRGFGRWPAYEGEPKYRAYKRGIIRAEPERWLMDWPKHPRLRPSMQNPSHPDHAYRSEPMLLEMGTRVPYAMALHHGGRAGPKGETVPARPLVSVPDAYKRAWIRAMGLHVQATIDGGTRRVRTTPRV